MTLTEFDVEIARTIVSNVTIVAENAEEAARIVASSSYELPREDMWRVISGGEITVRDEDGEVAAEDSWSASRIIPPAYSQPVLDSDPDEEGSAEVLEIADSAFRILLFAESTVVSLPATPADLIEAAGEIIIPATNPALTRELPLLVRARDGSEYPARVEPSALEGKTWIVLDEES
jgi:hypothetical protein